METSHSPLTFNRRAALRMFGLAAAGLTLRSRWRRKRGSPRVPSPSSFRPGRWRSDVAGRLLAQQLSSRLGQPVVVDNKAGASGAISGVLGAYLLLYPHARVLVAIPLGFFLHTMRIPARLRAGAVVRVATS